MATVNEYIKQLTEPPTGFASAYDAGKDVAINGANTVNSSYKWFTSKESTAEWERGNREGRDGDGE